MVRTNWYSAFTAVSYAPVKLEMRVYSATSVDTTKK